MSGDLHSFVNLCFGKKSTGLLTVISCTFISISTHVKIFDANKLATGMMLTKSNTVAVISFSSNVN